MRKYLLNLLIALDQGVNTFLGGDPDETISSRAGKGQAQGKRWACVLCRFLDWFQRDHCVKSIERNEGADAVVAD